MIILFVPMPLLSALYCYPVKSCRGVALSEATLDRRGIVHDREMLIVDAGNRFMTQRATPKLALIETTLTDDALVLRAPGAGGELRVPWHAPDRPAREVVVWKDAVVADDTGDAPAEWLSDVLGERCRLVTTGARSRRVRPVDRLPADVHPGVLARPVEIGFPDGYPLLVVSEESLDDLNRRLDLPEPLRMDRFRPNLVLNGCRAPYEEDSWKAFRVGAVWLFGGEPCGRCIVTTTDQQTLERTPEPLRTLATYRRTASGDVVFGQNAIHAEPGGRLRVGDTVVPEA